MRLILPAIFFCIPLSLAAQDEYEWKEPGPQSKAYHASRMKNTTPPYSLQKIKALISKIEFNEEEEFDGLSREAFEKLSLREKFTYSMLHAESYSQNCDAMPPIQDEHKKIFGYLPEAFDEHYWSERQLKFLADNRDSVIALLTESINRTKKIGLNYKHAILEIKAWEMIPLLVKTYKIKSADLDILTLLMQLMKEGEYQPFLESASFTKLYGEDASYLSYLNFNKANEELIIKRAMDFYNGKK
ncbi:MAG TPA: hypothetical protein PKC69_07510 [Chitinophagaceae bacterium]|nr:hypothetical protein [Chitinophagaceae bacterium]